MRKEEVFSLFIRYLILLFIGIWGMDFFYSILTPATVNSSFLLLKLFYPLSLEDTMLIFQGIIVNLVPACIAGSAYYLLLILNLSTPMHLKLRFKSLIFSFAVLFLLNLLRIAIFTVLLIEGFAYFDVAHKSVWYFGSTFLVVAIWFLSVSIFKIKEIPAYTDLKNLLHNIKHKIIKKRGKK